MMIYWLRKMKYVSLTSIVLLASLYGTFSHAVYLNVLDYSGTIKVGSSGLNVRETANWGRVVKKIYNGTAIRVIGHDGVWRHIYYSGAVQGWVHYDYISTSANATGCKGYKCTKQNPAQMKCTTASTLTTPWLGSQGTSASHKIQVRFSKDCDAHWIRIPNSRFSSDYMWIFSSNNTYWLDTDRFSDGIRRGAVQVEGRQISGGTVWSNMVTNKYSRVCVNGNTANLRSGQNIPDYRNCTSKRFSWLYKHPY